VSGVVAVDSRRRAALIAAGRVACFLLFALGIGGLGGLLWWRIVDLPGYAVDANGLAATSERGLAEFFGPDAWFAAIGLFIGVGLGVLAWRWFRDLGWPVALVAVIGALGAALICWALGYQLGPDDFEGRLAAANPGDIVAIQLTLRAKASLIVWPFAASIPVLLGSSLGRDDEETTPAKTWRRPRPRRHSA
jgi:hypothetical protein